jgi:hypothetical protein
MNEWSRYLMKNNNNKKYKQILIKKLNEHNHSKSLRN